MIDPTIDDLIALAYRLEALGLVQTGCATHDYVADDMLGPTKVKEIEEGHGPCVPVIWIRDQWDEDEVDS